MPWEDAKRFGELKLTKRMVLLVIIDYSSKPQQPWLNLILLGLIYYKLSLLFLLEDSDLAKVEKKKNRFSTVSANLTDYKTLGANGRGQGEMVTFFFFKKKKERYKMLKIKNKNKYFLINLKLFIFLNLMKRHFFKTSK